MREKSNLVGLLAVGLIPTIFIAISAQAATPKLPTFFARRDYPSALDASPIQIADTNGDGIPDLIVDSMGVVNVLLGNGDGTFRTGPNTHTVFYDSSAFVATDLNGDGIPDLVLSGGKDLQLGGIIVCMGNGDGTFTAGTYYAAGSGDFMAGLVVGDFNGDGTPDVAATGNGGIWLFTGQGGGTFNPGVMEATLSANPRNVAAADLNGDKKLDLVVSTFGSGFQVLFGNGNGTFQSPLTFTQPADAFGLAVGSLTKGGPPSIVLSGASTLYLYFGNGAGKFYGPVEKSTSGFGSVAIGDVNGDGLPDIVSAGVNILFGEGGGKFSEPYPYTISPNLYTANGATGLVLADLRNDGRTDIVTGGNYISVLLSLGKGAYEDGIWTNVTGGAGCGAAADFNRDGKPDLAVDNSNGISILLGTGKYLTPYTAGTNIALSGAGCLVTGDLNGDGIPDLLVTVNGTTLAVNAYLGKGDGTFTLASTTPTLAGGYLAVGDFNHDGKLDFASSGNLIALGNGDGTFQSPIDIMANRPSGGFSGIAVGDINNDGWQDIVLTANAFPTDADVTVLLNNKQSGFTQVATTFGPLTYNPILVDLNGDGYLDLVLSQAGLLYTDPELYGAGIYLGNGAGGFVYQQVLGVALPGATLNFVSDLNGDGIPDIGVLALNTVQIFIGQGGASYAAPISVGSGPSPGSVIVEDLHGQSPKAGIPDIVVPDTSGGVMVLLNLTP